MNFNVDDLTKIIDSINVSVGKESVVTKKEDPLVKPKRCQNDGCKIKLVLSDFACKCNKFYCSQHRYSDVHSCPYDYKAAGKNVLEKQMPAISAMKVDQI